MASLSWSSAINRAIARVIVYSVLLGVIMFACIASTSAQIPSASAKYKPQALAAWRSVWGIQAPTATFAAQVHAESGWNPLARSYVGARGLTQFMPSTANDVQARYAKEFVGLSMFSPVWAFKAQAIYMRELQEGLTGKDICERMAFTLAAYNGGKRRVLQRKALSKFPDVCFNETCNKNPGISASNQRENVEYPVRILKLVEPRYQAALWGPSSCH